MKPMKLVMKRLGLVERISAVFFESTCSFDTSAHQTNVVHQLPPMRTPTFWVSY